MQMGDVPWDTICESHQGRISNAAIVEAINLSLNDILPKARRDKGNSN
jgi:hypothetical protein